MTLIRYDGEKLAAEKRRANALDAIAEAQAQAAEALKRIAESSEAQAKAAEAQAARLEEMRLLLKQTGIEFSALVQIIERYAVNH